MLNMSTGSRSKSGDVKDTGGIGASTLNRNDTANKRDEIKTVSLTNKEPAYAGKSSMLARRYVGDDEIAISQNGSEFAANMDDYWAAESELDRRSQAEIPGYSEKITVMARRHLDPRESRSGSISEPDARGEKEAPDSEGLSQKNPKLNQMKGVAARRYGDSVRDSSSTSERSSDLASSFSDASRSKSSGSQSRSAPDSHSGSSLSSSSAQEKRSGSVSQSSSKSAISSSKEQEDLSRKSSDELSKSSGSSPSGESSSHGSSSNSQTSSSGSPKSGASSPEPPQKSKVVLAEVPASIGMRAKAFSFSRVQPAFRSGLPLGRFIILSNRPKVNEGPNIFDVRIGGGEVNIGGCWGSVDVNKALNFKCKPRSETSMLPLPVSFAEVDNRLREREGLVGEYLDLDRPPSLSVSDHARLFEKL